ncbi:hypothetical protein B0I28_109114 [Glycomyces artemisiae]|uniref:Uncharacterized protein n=1 Tax=Glycomyces artemisiae TaxID=1076443 RepID=A0A2T0UEU3_9ACTN|nr:hypothetical protein B0I28_109114 [Glycomyces artemisiae]
MAEPTSGRCALCEHPEEGHGVRYAAGVGDHEFVHDAWTGRAPRPAVESDRPSRAPEIYRAPDGGLAMWPDPSRPAPSGGGDRLPPRRTASPEPQQSITSRKDSHA